MKSKIQYALVIYSFLLFGIHGESVLDVGLRMTVSQSTVTWSEDLVVNLTCVGSCPDSCSGCDKIYFLIESRNKTYMPGETYSDFKFHPLVNLTKEYKRTCTISQTVSLLNIRKTDSGPLYCTNKRKASGSGFLQIFYDVTHTNVTLPTEVSIKSVEVESTGVKINIKQRTFNTTDPNNIPHVNCSLMGGNGAGADFNWVRGNGSSISADDGITQIRIPKTGTLDRGDIVGMLQFNEFGKKAALNVGQYQCKFAGQSSHMPTVFSAPVVTVSEKDYRSVMEGDTLTQACTVVAYPSPVIAWTKDNGTLDKDGGRIKFSEDNKTLTITSLKKEDHGVYICTATNSLGVGQNYIKLRVKDRLAALWPFLGILAEVAILVTIILLYEKKRAAQKRSQEDQDTAEVKEDRNANDSDVRHRPVKT